MFGIKDKPCQVYKQKKISMIFLLFRYNIPLLERHINEHKVSFAIIEVMIFCSFSETKIIVCG